MNNCDMAMLTSLGFDTSRPIKSITVGNRWHLTQDDPTEEGEEKCLKKEPEQIPEQ